VTAKPTACRGVCADGVGRLSLSLLSAAVSSTGAVLLAGTGAAIGARQARIAPLAQCANVAIGITVTVRIITIDESVAVFVHSASTEFETDCAVDGTAAATLAGFATEQAAAETPRGLDVARTGEISVLASRIRAGNRIRASTATAAESFVGFSGLQSTAVGRAIQAILTIAGFTEAVAAIGAA